ncbi:10044_t:CDS:2 [Rhizophagus irregularis]|nr:10044_t:CDS:2 [Rhizophagus irregularis]
MESVRRSTRKRKCVDYNDNYVTPTGAVNNLNSPDYNSLQGSPRMSTQKTPRNGENVASLEHAQTKKKKKLSLDNKESELNERYEGAQEVNMVVIVEKTPTIDSVKGDDLFDDGELSDPPDLDKNLESDNNFKLQDKQNKKTPAKSLNTGRKEKSAPAKENDGAKKRKDKKQIVSTMKTTNISTPLQTKNALGGLKRKAIGKSNPLTPKFTSDSKPFSGPLSKAPTLGLSRKLKVKSLHPYLKKQ